MLIRVVDFETTGLEPPAAAVCEIGWCDVTREGFDWFAGKPSSFLCDPRRPMPAEVRAVHHISDAELLGQVTSEEGLARFAGQQPTPDYYCACNAPFEQKFFCPDGSKWLDTYRSAKHAYPENEAGFGNQTMRYWLGLELDPVLADPPHRAGPDAYVTAEVLAHMLNNGFDVEQLHAWSTQPLILKICNLKKYKGMPWSEVPRDYLDWILRQPPTDWDPDILHTARHYRGGGAQPTML